MPDYIIVGGGTAGLVLANRLSENSTVVVLEAGGDNDKDFRVLVPGLWRANLEADNDWAFQTTPQEHLNGRIISQPQGKMLGGSSSLNALALIPPSASDLDAWEKLGNAHWNWKTIKPYLDGFFSLSEPDRSSYDSLDLGWSKNAWSSGTKSLLGGPVMTSFCDVKEEGRLASTWAKAIKALGYPLTDNPFDGASTGPYNAASTIDPTTKTRVNSSIAYYHPAKDRKNLQVLTDCLVEKIIIDEKGIASGAQYTLAGERNTITAAKEVIVCAGAFQSPKLLELSGIGDPAVLSEHGIDVKVANPYVGTNLQDHLMHGISFEVRDGFPTRDDLIRRDPVALQAAEKAYQEGSGPLCSSAVTTFAYLPVDDFKKDTHARESFLAQLSQAEAKHPLDKHRMSVLQNLIEHQIEGTAQYFPVATQLTISQSALLPGSFVTFMASLSHPLSTGTVHVASADATAKPTIDHQYMSHPLDLELQARHIRYTQSIAASQPFTEFLKPGGRRNNDAAFIGDDLEKAKEYVKLAGSSNYHSCGTCAMAPKESGGVVDSEFRVYGVKNLRVVDASVIPLVPQSNTQMLVYGVAERAADLIRGQA